MKRRTLAKFAGISLAVILALFVAGLFIGRTQSFHRFVLSKLASQVKTTTGADLQIGSYTFRWHGLRVDLYNVVIRGTEGAGAEPLLRADHAEMSFKLVSVLQRKIDLSELIVDHPVVHLAFDRQGNSNLPQPPSVQNSSTRTNVFDLGLQHVQLQHGEIYDRDQKTPLNAELYGLQMQVVFERLSNAYRGSLSYASGRIELPHYEPLQHQLQAEFHAHRSHLSFDHLSLTTNAFTFEGNGRIDDYSNPSANLEYRLVLFTPQLAHLMHSAALPQGDVTLAGNLQYHNSPGAPVMQSVTLAGKLSSPALSVRTSSTHFATQNLSAAYRLQAGNLEVKDLHAGLFGGALSGNVLVRNLAGPPDSTMQLQLLGASLPVALQSAGVKSLPLAGKFRATANAAAKKGFKFLVAHSNIMLEPGAGVRGQGGQWVPLFGAAHLTYDSPRSLITIAQTSLQTPRTSLALSGTLSTNSNLAVQLRTADLSELSLIAAALKPASGTPNKTIPQLYGSAAFNGAVHGPMSAPQLVGMLTATDFQVQGSRWRSLRANLDLSPSLASLQNGELQAAPQGSIKFDVRAALRRWSYLPSDPIALRINASGLQVGDLERLANLHYPVSGALSANLNISGSQANPVGQGNLQLVNGKIAGESIQNLRLTFQGNGELVDSHLSFRMPAGGGAGELRYFPRTQGYQGNFSVRDFHLDQLQTVRSRDLQISGVLNASLSGTGTVKSPQLNATLTIPNLKIHQQEITGIRAQLGVANHVATIALDSDLSGAYIRAHGTVNLDANEEAFLAIDTRAIPLQPLLARYLSAQASDLRGQVELHGWLRGPLKQPALLQAQVQVPHLQLGYKALDLHNAGPIRMDYRNGILNIQPSELQGTGTQLRIGGSIPIKSAAPLSLDATGTISLAIAQAVMANDVETAGQLAINLKATAPSGGKPGVQGTLRLVNAYFHSNAAPLGVENLNGEILVQNDRITINQLAGDSGGGKVSLQGAVTYHPQVQFNLALIANTVRLRYPAGVRTILDSSLTFIGSPASSALTGQVLINRLSLTKDFDMATFMDQFSGQAAPAPTSSFMQNMRLDVAVQSTEQLGLTSSKLSMRGSANLRVSGTADDPVILGRANLNIGEIFFLGKRYEIENSVLDFNNPVRTQPTVNLRATTVVDQYNLSMNFVGPIDHLRTTYTSDPPLPPVDIINLLAFGKTTEASASTPSTPGNLGAASVLAQGLSSQVSSRVEKLAGISQLSIDPNLGGNNQNPGARLAIQQRLTKNLLVTFATDVTSTQREVIQLEYHLTPRWSVRAVRDQNGGYAFDAHMHHIF